MFVAIAFCNTYNRCHFSKGCLTTWTLFWWWLRQEKKGGLSRHWLWIWSKYSQLCTYLQHCLDECDFFVIWQDYLLDRLVTWQCWSGNFGLRGTEPRFESLHVLPFKKVSGLLRSGIWHQDVVVQIPVQDIEGLHELCVGVGLRNLLDCHCSVCRSLWHTRGLSWGSQLR